MRAFICGIDGYLGWGLACHLASLGHVVAGIDSLQRREWVGRVGGMSITPIENPETRRDYFHEDFQNHQPLFFQVMNLAPGLRCEGDAAPGRYHDLVSHLKAFGPDVVYNLAQQPSAPFSMIDQGPAVITAHGNYVGNRSLLWAIREACPKTHLVKLGTMGEYGTPGIPIPEGVFPEGSRWTRDEPKPLSTTDVTDAGGRGTIVQDVGPLAGMMFPRKPGSFYHSTKVAETIDCDFAVRAWGLNITDVMQGVVYGTRWGVDAPTERTWTRLDVDEVFGTCVNRFVAQALIGHPLTVYGKGGQTRGYLPLLDSMRCLTLLGENPATGYRVVNQLEQCHSVQEIADTVSDVAFEEYGIASKIEHCDNPRVEEEEHTYEVETGTLRELGYQPASDLKSVVAQMIEDLQPYTSRIERISDVLAPKTQWR
jgi:UDP-sulfoquinovose synthase